MVSEISPVAAAYSCHPELWVRNVVRGAYLISAVVATALWNLQASFFATTCSRFRHISLFGVAIKYPFSLVLTTASASIAVLATGFFLLQLYQHIRPLPRNITQVL